MTIPRLRKGVAKFSTKAHEYHNPAKRTPRVFGNYTTEAMEVRFTVGNGVGGEIIMSPPEEVFDDFDNDELWNYTPPKNVQYPAPPSIPLSSSRVYDANPQNQAVESEQMPWKRSRENDAAPQSVAQRPTQEPWKRSNRPFVGDIAIAGMRDKTLTPSLLSAPPAPPSRSKYRIAVPLAGVAMITAVGIVGYKSGSGPPAPLPQPAAHSGQFEQSGLVSGKSQRSEAFAKFPASAANTSLIRSESHQINPSAIATKMKIGVELMTYGKIIKAREMFQPVAEAGEGAGAFALAETYDPIVLEGLGLKERVVPDLALAHDWYARARDLGLPEARDRIFRLAQSPQ